MTFKELTSFVKINNRKRLKERPSKADWLGWEDINGLLLPLDYKQIVSYYGSGTFGSLLTVWNPFSNHPHFDMASRVTQKVNDIPDAFDPINWKERKYPKKVFPEPGGLLPFASTTYPYILMWLTEGDPNLWKIIIDDFTSDTEFSVETSLIDVIYKILSRNGKEGEISFWNLAENNEFEPLPV